MKRIRSAYDEVATRFCEADTVRYFARPPLGNARLAKQADSRYLLRSKSRSRDGTTHLRLDPLEVMERLAAQIPKPRISLVLYSVVLAPHAKLRPEVAAQARTARWSMDD